MFDKKNKTKDADLDADLKGTAPRDIPVSTTDGFQSEPQLDVPADAPLATPADQPLANPSQPEPQRGPQGEITAPVAERIVQGDGKVRAKFKCLGVDQQPGDNGYALRFEAVTNGSRENTQFFRWTPSGQLTMGVVSEETAKKFEAGREYYLDFTPA